MYSVSSIMLQLLESYKVPVEGRVRDTVRLPTHEPFLLLIAVCFAVCFGNITLLVNPKRMMGISAFRRAVISTRKADEN